MNDYVKILPYQSIFDVAIQKYGTSEAAVEIAKLNTLSITDELEPGTKIYLPDSAPLNQDIKSYYERHNIKPATAKIETDIQELFEENGDGQTPPIYTWSPEFL